MKSVKLLVPLVLFLFISGCGEEAQLTGPAGCAGAVCDFDNLFQSWTRSYEEEADPNNWADQIYRPSNSRQFPSSLFRQRYVFDHEGTGEWLVLHPADSHYMSATTWEAGPEEPNLISIYDTEGTNVVRFRILELKPDFMRIKSLKYEVPWCYFHCGQVVVLFRKEATFDEVDAFVRSVELEYFIHHWGEVGVYGALVIFTVPIGTEEEWIERFQKEPLVESSFRPGETP